MKNKRLAIALSITLMLGLAATAYAAETTAPQTNNTIHQRFGMGMGKAAGFNGHDSITSVLKDKLSLTDKEITDWLNSGKTLYDLAKSKGMTDDQFKAALLEERTKAIDEAVAKGTLTKEQADIMKENIKNNINNCTGTTGQGCMQNAGAGCGMAEKGHMQGRGMNFNGMNGRGLAK